MASRTLLLLPGDGIGPEAMAEVEKLIAVMNADEKAGFETGKGLVGGSAYDAHGKAISDDDMARAMAADAVLFGAVGGPKWDGVAYEVRPEAGLLRLRKDMELFANLRPAICYPALAESSSLKKDVVEGLDILIVRELTGGVYFGEPKQIIDLGNGQKRGIDTQVYDTFEIERISGVAFELARTRSNKVCSMEKRNVMKSGVLWNEVVTATHKARYADVELSPHAGRCRRHAAGPLAQAVRRHRHRQPLRRHAVRRRRHADRIARHAAFGFARRAGRQDRQAQGALRARARLGARHRRPGHRQSDRHDRVLRHVPALFVRNDRTGGPSGTRRSPPCSTRACVPATSWPPA